MSWIIHIRVLRDKMIFGMGVVAPFKVMANFRLWVEYDRVINKPAYYFWIYSFLHVVSTRRDESHRLWSSDRQTKKYYTYKNTPKNIDDGDWL